MILRRSNCDHYITRLRQALPDHEIHARRFTDTKRVQIVVSANRKPPYLPCELVETTARAEELIANKH